MATRLVRNTTISDIFLDDVGVRIPVGVTYTIPPTDITQWTKSAETGGDANPFILNGDLVVNDGIQDLDAEVGLSYLQLDPVNVRISGTDLATRVKVFDFVGATGATGPGESVLLENIFGSYYQQERDDVLQTVTGTTDPQTVLTLTTPNIPAGVYRFGAEIRASVSNQNANVIGRVDIDSGAIVSPLFFAFTLDTTTPAVTYVNAEVPLAAGVHTYELQVAPDNTNRVANVTGSLVEMWRVGP